MRALVFDFLSHHARMLGDWAERTERVFEQWDDPLTDRAELAAEIIRANLADYPDLDAPR